MPSSPICWVFSTTPLPAPELGEEELTYDLSVPSNVTYIANGFVSHNTIGLLMDCDTTGIEPDLGLVKTKKLVGGGTMSISTRRFPGVAPAGLFRGRDLRYRFLCRRAQVDPRRAPHLCRPPRSICLLDGRQHHPLPGACAHDGGSPAVPLRRHLQDGQHARRSDHRGRRATAHRSLADGHQGCRHLPGQLQSGPALGHDQAGGGGIVRP